MKKLPFEVRMDLEGWRLFWARLEVEREAETELAALLGRVASNAQDRFADTSKIVEPVEGDLEVVDGRFRRGGAGCSHCEVLIVPRYAEGVEDRAGESVTVPAIGGVSCVSGHFLPSFVSRPGS